MKERPIIGIDLGTTNSVVAYWDRIAGKPKIIPNQNGEFITPSVVGLNEGGEIIVGRVARNRTYIDPNNTIVSVKREMGTKKEYLLKGKKMLPHQVSAIILNSLKEQAERYLGMTIERAVITYPIRFGEAQIDATRMAGELTGLMTSDEPLLLDEPSAALISTYGTYPISDGIKLVYDLGGGTFDISIISVIKGRPIYKATGGNPYLGGDDFDRWLLELIQKKLIEEKYYDIELTKSTVEGRTALQILKIEAEKAKITLSSKESVPILIPELCVDKRGEIVTVDIVVTRSEFEDLIRETIEDSIHMCKEALKEANMSEQDVDEIILSGGSTQIPLVAELIEEAFGKKLRTDINSVTCVAEGAAIFTATLSTETVKTKGELVEIRFPAGIQSPTSNKKPLIAGKVRPFRSSLSLEDTKVIVSRDDSKFRIEVPLNKMNGFLLELELKEETESTFQLLVKKNDKELGKYSFKIKHDSEAKTIYPPQALIPYPLSVGLREGKIAVLIEKNTSLPVEKTRIFYTSEDNQTTLRIPIYEGDYPIAERNKQIEEVMITNIPPGLPKGTEVEVAFEIGKDRIIHVSVDLPKVGVSATAQIIPDWPDTNLRSQSIRVKEISDDIRKMCKFVPPSQKAPIVAKAEKRIKEAESAIKDGEEGRADAKRRELEEIKDEIEEIAISPELVDEFNELSEKLFSLTSKISLLEKEEIGQKVKACQMALEKVDKNDFELSLKALHQLHFKIIRTLEGEEIDRKMIENFLLDAVDEVVKYARDEEEITQAKEIFEKGKKELTSGNFQQAFFAVEKLEQLAKRWEDREKIVDTPI